MQDLELVMTTLADDFKVGPFAYAIDGDAALVRTVLFENCRAIVS